MRWESAGDGEFTVEAVERAERGTRVTLHLREDAREFAEDLRLRTLIRKYSDHIAFPVLMRARRAEGRRGCGARKPSMRPARCGRGAKGEIKDEEYQEFYRHIAHDFTAPLAWSHNRVEGKRVYTSLLYVPARAPFDLWNREKPRGLKLYVRRVFILDDAAQFLPLYLRFMRGVIDAEGLALNVSRELLQQDPEVDAIRGGLTRRVLDMLDKLADGRSRRSTEAFWKEFGRVLKEGPAEDPANTRTHRRSCCASPRPAAPATSRIAVSPTTSPARRVDQKHIWYLTADSLAAARGSPHLEIFRQRGIEVLLLTDSIDEWMVGYLGEFEGMELRDVRRGELEADELGGSAEAAAKAAEGEHKELLERLTKALGEDVESVRDDASAH